MIQNEGGGIYIDLTPEQARQLSISLSNLKLSGTIDTPRVLYVDDFDNIGKQLRNIRLKQGINISDLAKEVGITQAFMCKVEHGKMTLTKTKQLMAWIKALGFDEVHLNLKRG